MPASSRSSSAPETACASITTSTPMRFGGFWAFWVNDDPMPSGVRVWLATGHTDMRRGMPGLALQVQEQLKRDPHGGDLYIFCGRRGDLAKVLWHDGVGLSLYANYLTSYCTSFRWKRAS